MQNLHAVVDAFDDIDISDWADARSLPRFTSRDDDSPFGSDLDSDEITDGFTVLDTDEAEAIDELETELLVVDLGRLGSRWSNVRFSVPA